MIEAAIVFGALTVVLLVLFRLMRLVHGHVAYYLPSVTLAQLSKQLRDQLALTDAIAKRLGTDATSLVTALEDVQMLNTHLGVIQEAMTTAIKESLDAWLAKHTPSMVEDAVRSVSLRVSNNLQMGLIERTTKLGGEYVLLQTLDDLDVRVELTANSYEPQAIREALVRLLKWHPTREVKVRNEDDLAKWLIERTRSRQELDQLLGHLGQDLFTLRWSGAMALRTASQFENEPTTERLVNLPTVAV